VAGGGGGEGRDDLEIAIGFSKAEKERKPRRHARAKVDRGGPRGARSN